MTAPLRILGIDPSCTNAAAALVIDDNPRNPNLGRLERFWHVHPKGGTLALRLFDLLWEVQGVIAAARPHVLVIEMPADQARGRRRQNFSARSVLTLPNYGAAVGVCLAASAAWGESDEARMQLFPSVSEWTGRDVPGTAGDEDKAKRVAYVELLYGLEKGVLGARTVAGNAADAVLLARWGLMVAAANGGAR